MPTKKEMQNALNKYKKIMIDSTDIVNQFSNHMRLAQSKSNNIVSLQNRNVNLADKYTFFLEKGIRDKHDEKIIKEFLNNLASERDLFDEYKNQQYEIASLKQKLSEKKKELVLFDEDEDYTLKDADRYLSNMDDSLNKMDQALEYIKSAIPPIERSLNEQKRFLDKVKANDTPVDTIRNVKEESSRTNARSRRKGSKTIIALFAVLLSFLFFFILFINQDAQPFAINSTPNQIEESNYADVFDDYRIAELSDFEYKVDNGGIILGKYLGNRESIIIPASFNIENDVVPVIKIDGCFNENESVKNVIISDGIETIGNGTFRNGIVNLYIPASFSFSITAISFDNDGEFLYFGGSEEQWDSINPERIIARSSIGFKNIIFDATIDSCISNINTKAVMSEDNDLIHTPLEDFLYDVRYGQIILDNYIGKEKNVNIAASYFVDGRYMNVVELHNTFAQKKIDVAIVPEGVVKLSKATFNSCGASVIYLPSTINIIEDGFWEYFHNLETLYYGGSQEEFDSLCSVGRWNVDIKNIVYNSSINDVGR